MVTLASVVELETARGEERPRIAAVFKNRLRFRMPLQTDPTVIYALKKAGTYDGNIRRADLAVDSPYNTYRYPGLPPGPIASPGRDAIRAVLQPADRETSTSSAATTARTSSATNLADHNRAVTQYQRRGAVGAPAGEAPVVDPWRPARPRPWCRPLPRWSSPARAADWRAVAPRPRTTGRRTGSGRRCPPRSPSASCSSPGWSRTAVPSAPATHGRRSASRRAWSAKAISISTSTPRSRIPSRAPSGRIACPSIPCCPRCSRRRVFLAAQALFLLDETGSGAGRQVGGFPVHRHRRGASCSSWWGGAIRTGTRRGRRRSSPSGPRCGRRARPSGSIRPPCCSCASRSCSWPWPSTIPCGRAGPDSRWRSPSPRATPTLPSSPCWPSGSPRAGPGASRRCWPGARRSPCC